MFDNLCFCSCKASLTLLVCSQRRPAVAAAAAANGHKYQASKVWNTCCFWWLKFAMDALVTCHLYWTCLECYRGSLCGRLSAELTLVEAGAGSWHPPCLALTAF